MPLYINKFVHKRKSDITKTINKFYNNPLIKKKALKSYYEEVFTKLSEPNVFKNNLNFINKSKSYKNCIVKDNNKLNKVSKHINIHNYHTIKWLRRKLGNDTIKKSIFSLLPNNGSPTNINLNEQKSNTQKIKEFLNSYLIKEKNVLSLSPDYLFTKEALNKIYMLRDIFLEFDEDGSRKLEMGELQEMFEKNKIFIHKDDLPKLFFPNIKNSGQDDLNFYEFLEFALSARSDQDFRNLMRRLKIENKNKSSQTIKLVESPSYDNKCNIFKKSSSNISSNSIDIDEYLNQKVSKKFLPMNFNLVLDYFNKKGKARDKEKQIKKAIARMKKICETKTLNTAREDNKNTITSKKSKSRSRYSVIRDNDNLLNKNTNKYSNKDLKFDDKSKIDENLEFGSKHKRNNLNNTDSYSNQNSISKNSSLNEESDVDSNGNKFNPKILDSHNYINIEDLDKCFKFLFNQKRAKEAINNTNSNKNQSKLINTKINSNKIKDSIKTGRLRSINIINSKVDYLVRLSKNSEGLNKINNNINSNIILKENKNTINNINTDNLLSTKDLHKIKEDLDIISTENKDNKLDVNYKISSNNANLNIAYSEFIKNFNKISSLEDNKNNSKIKILENYNNEKNDMNLNNIEDKKINKSIVMKSLSSVNNKSDLNSNNNIIKNNKSKIKALIIDKSSPKIINDNNSIEYKLDKTYSSDNSLNKKEEMIVDSSHNIISINKENKLGNVTVNSENNNLMHSYYNYTSDITNKNDLIFTNIIKQRFKEKQRKLDKIDNIKNISELSTFYSKLNKNNKSDYNNYLQTNMNFNKKNVILQNPISTKNNYNNLYNLDKFNLKKNNINKINNKTNYNFKKEYNINNKFKQILQLPDNISRTYVKLNKIDLPKLNKRNISNEKIPEFIVNNL